MGPQLSEYPFRCVFSLRPLIEFWRRNVAAGLEYGSCLVEGLEAKLERAPELLDPIENLTVLDQHQDLLKSLMSLVFPPAFWNTDLVGAFVPFNLQPVYTSPSFKRLLLNDDGTFKSPEDLRVHYDALRNGQDADEIIFYCGSGVTAAQNVLAMEHAGLPGARMYVGSWSEWIVDPDREVEL